MKRKESKETRFERWLSLVSVHLQERQNTCRLAYDDHHLGKRLALSISSEAGLCEVQAIRGRKGANLCLLAETEAALAQLNQGLVGLRDKAKRRHNAKRKFLHRLERLGTHLAETWTERSHQFPQGAFGRLRSLVPEATAMTGVRAPFLERKDADAERLEIEGARGLVARQLKRFPLLYAAKIPTATGGRAALYYRGPDGFRVRGDAVEQVARRLRESGADPAACALLTVEDPETGQEKGWETVVEFATKGADLAVDAADATFGAIDIAEAVSGSDSCWDVGGVDLPDCGGCDGLDCSF